MSATTTAPITDEAAFAIGQRVRIDGVDRYVYTIAKRRQITATRSQMPEYLILDANGQRCGWQYENTLRTVPVCPECGAAVTVREQQATSPGGSDYEVATWECRECEIGGEA